MLTKAQRLKTRADFARCYQRGMARHGRYIVVRSKPNQLNHNRYGIVISKKVSKSAVVRNKIKRQISEILRTSDIRVANNDIVIVVKAQNSIVSYEQLKQDIITVLTMNNPRSS